MNQRLPVHRNPTRADRRANAPYNFIPLPETIVRAAVSPEEDLPDHDRFHADRHTGYLDVLLTTKSPLFIRGPVTVSDYHRMQEDDGNKPFREQIKNRPDFFFTQDSQQPVIPGSSLRGMLRSLLEIVSYGKMKWVTGKHLFFRTVDSTTVGIYYGGRMTGKVETGFLRKNGHVFYIKTCNMVRVERSLLGGVNSLYDDQGVPRWSREDLVSGGNEPGQTHQYMPVWIKENEGKAFALKREHTQEAGWHEGRLVITGDVPRKKREFVFLLPEKDSPEINVDPSILQRFHDDDQITQWQERAFPKGKPEKDCRQRPGMFRKDRYLSGEADPHDPGDPVFFLRENGKLTFLGRAGMFRLPYRQRAIDLIPEELREIEDIDYAEALFGFVRTGEEIDELRRRGKEPIQGSKSHAYASRVFVTDATLDRGQSSEDIWASRDPIVPRILASPKPTAFQHYLVQENPDDTQIKIF
ncbi:MAG: TIGR03986 family CRISPR-associated RAMP protein [Firmicutes bacterium]|nr:TIGR03986 family CRISPR-associated RAMP protein [Bacillota bacterium]